MGYGNKQKGKEWACEQAFRIRNAWRKSTDMWFRDKMIEEMVELIDEYKWTDIKNLLTEIMVDMRLHGKR